MKDIYNYSSYTDTKDRFRVETIFAKTRESRSFKFSENYVQHQFAVNDFSGNVLQVTGLARQNPDGTVDESRIYGYTIHKERQGFDFRNQKDVQPKAVKEITLSANREKYFTSTWRVTLYGMDLKNVTGFTQHSNHFTLYTVTDESREYMKERMQGYPSVNALGEFQAGWDNTQKVIQALHNAVAYRRDFGKPNALCRNYAAHLDLETGRIKLVDKKTGQGVTDPVILKKLFSLQ